MSWVKPPATIVARPGGDQQDVTHGDYNRMLAVTPSVTGGQSPSRLRWLGGVTLLAALYFGAAKLGLSLAFEQANVSPVWPPTGLALAVLLVWGPRYWPGIAVGAFLANASTEVSALTAAGIAVGNTLEALVGAYLLRRVHGFSADLRRLRDVLALVILAAGVSTVVSVTIGVGSLWLGGSIRAEAAPLLWRLWWLGDAMGDVVVAPLLLTWARAGVTLSPRRAIEGGALLVSLVAVTGLVFGSATTVAIEYRSAAYLIFPWMIWAALRFGQRGVALAAAVASSVAIVGTLQGAGPFHLATPTASLIALQLYMSVVTISSLMLGAVLAERQDAADALEQQAVVLENMAEGVLVTDTGGQIVYANPAFERMFGYADGELAGRNTAELNASPLDEKVRLLAEVHATLRAAGYWSGEFLNQRKDGSLFVTAARIKAHAVESVEYLISVQADVTERRRAEHEREELLRDEQAARQTAQAALAVRDEFLSQAAHELKTPLTALKVSAEIMARTGAYNERANQIILQQARRLERLIGDLLDVSRLESGQLQLRRREVDLLALVRDAVESALLADARRTIRIVAPAEPLRGWWDPDRLVQILDNLLSNALKYSPPDGEVLVTVLATGPTVQVRVRDHGMGIAAEALPRVFDRFYRAQGALTGPPGLGLGLPIARSLVEAHGGRIWVESAGPQQGSTFTVELPRQPPAGPASVVGGA
ncbi:MAG TPA: MASE1 domain-containing protein [Chloroflexota bacterium]